MNAVIKPHELQGSAEWLEYRRSRGNASELGALMGCNPWFPRTPYELWLVKTGRAEVAENEAMRRGTRLEPAARAYAEGIFDEVFEPQVRERNRLSASLDGQTLDGDCILELKVPMRGRDSEAWQYVEEHQTPPEHYLWQVQQQLYCSGAKLANFVVCHAEGDEIIDAIYCDVLPDQQMHTAIEAAWAGFFEHLDSDTPPPLTDRDVEERTDREWRDAVHEYKATKRDLEDAKQRHNDARERLIALAGERSVVGAGLKATRFWKSGGTDWRKAATAAGVDPSQYEKEGGWQWRFTEAD